MTTSLRVSLLAALAATGVLAPSAAAHAERDLWATVNICDTKRHPNDLGVRARMPGNGTRERMYMRFVAQYRDGRRWRQVDRHAASSWLFAGSALVMNQELGYTFRFIPPPKGTTYLMRGLVKFEWRARRAGRWRVVRREQLATSAGHRSRGADPKGYSAATCRIG